MRWVSSRCVDIYMCRISHGSSGLLFIFIICRYGDVFASVDILVTFPRNEYLL